jgi:hypothetical protein
MIFLIYFKFSLSIFYLSECGRPRSNSLKNYSFEFKVSKLRVKTSSFFKGGCPDLSGQVGLKRNL